MAEGMAIAQRPSSAGKAQRQVAPGGDAGIGSWRTLASNHMVLIATGQPYDDEMAARIARHQADRADRVPGMTTEAA
jgi:hypothetical protein